MMQARLCQKLNSSTPGMTMMMMQRCRVGFGRHNKPLTKGNNEVYDKNAKDSNIAAAKNKYTIGNNGINGPLVKGNDYDNAPITDDDDDDDEPLDDDVDNNNDVNNIDKAPPPCLCFPFSPFDCCTFFCSKLQATAMLLSTTTKPLLDDGNKAPPPSLLSI
jgi:hypothetical protein